MTEAPETLHLLAFWSFEQAQAAVGLLALLLVMLRGVHVLVDKAFERWKGASQRSFNMTTHPQLRRDQSLLMRTAADEAGFVLGVGATFAWAIERFGATLSAIAKLPTAIAVLSQRLFVRCFSQPALVHMLAVLVAVNGVAVVTALFCVLLPVPSLQPAAMAFLVVLALMAAPGFVLLMSSFAQGLINAGFGREIVLHAPFVSGTAETTPLGYWSVFQFPALAQLPLGRLQHSFIYESASLRYVAARWLLFGEFNSKAYWREGRSLLPYQGSM